MSRGHYGWKPDRKDSRDHKFRLPWFSITRYMPEALLPDLVDLTDICPPVMDQGQLGSCTAHAVTAALRYNLIDNGETDIFLSRLQLYYDSRALEGTVDQDAGAEIRDVIKVAAKHGVGRELFWPYDLSKWNEKPAEEVYRDAVNFEALDYQSVETNTRAVKTALYVGHPVVIGVTLFESFESDEVANDGVVPMPGRSEREVGGHCMLVAGYGKKPGYFTVLNSWGASWGDRGWCYLPEQYLPQYGADFWTILQNNK